MVDIKGQLTNKNWICQELHSAIENTLKNKHKVLLFLNRRGYAPIVICSGCGFKIPCPNCSITLVWHKQINKMICSYCDFTQTLKQSCPQCQSESWSACGPGVERIQETITKIFPYAKTCIVSKDTMSTQNKISSLLDNIKDHGIDIIIGTQIITKGFNFPNLSLIGVIDADFALYGSDLRAKEKTFQILHQVSGRPGREGNKSKVLIQTYFSSSDFMQTLANNDFIKFVKSELIQRKAHNLPPFKKACKILITSKKQQNSIDIAKQICQNIYNQGIFKILGPTDARTVKINKEYRVKILLIENDVLSIHKAVNNSIKNMKIPSSVKVKIDIDPYDFD